MCRANEALGAMNSKNPTDRLCKYILIKKKLKRYKMIGKIGDKIKWDFKDDRFKNYPKFLRGNTFTADIAMVDLKEKYYGVYCEYGQDLIPFDKCELFPTNKG